jgi:hypothetical protein
VVKYLELGASKLYGVCEVDSSRLAEGPLFYSPEVRHRGGRDIELLGLAITRKPASVALGPLVAYPGTLHDASRQIVYQDGFIGKLIRRADEFDRRRKHGEPLTIAGVQAKPVISQPSRAAGPLEIRSAQALDVDAKRRRIRVLAVPYGVEAPVPLGGRIVMESFANIAFAGRAARTDLLHPRARRATGDRPRR